MFIEKKKKAGGRKEGQMCVHPCVLPKCEMRVQVCQYQPVITPTTTIICERKRSSGCKGIAVTTETERQECRSFRSSRSSLAPESVVILGFPNPRPKGSPW